ncbi:flagellar protein export ATPase FliI [Microaerobacter geothermalis]|uniref:flagellar protein export ATPase FliI n=1 Tax=Microaerobacter geothermalis TaxID=674972 RepID=UPI001F380CA1|nr:flagellar protein export ATPase FliI [Microaerobacter geothermalis]MCF6093837.1 flagellar protein export ATPase FliI [Microaerobacter geothermalis]
MAVLDIQRYKQLIEHSDPFRLNGKVTQVIGLTVESEGPDTKIGDVCLLYPVGQNSPVPAEVVGFRNHKVLLMPFGDLGSIGPGCDVVSTGKSLIVKVGKSMLGRIVDGLGNPIDDQNLPEGLVGVSTNQSPPNPLKRPRIMEPLSVGVRAIDGLLSVGKGQRIGIFAGSGVGKSTLLGMIARNTSADVNIIALIGERGREVLEFVEKDLGKEGLARSILVVATSDQPALMRIKGAMVATAFAEYFRDMGLDVMLMMDSITRFAMAQREVGLAIGEPPTAKGYTPSVFSLLPKLLERSGTNQKGTITAFYTVLVDGDDLNEPISDTVRGILDGHIVLDRTLANKGHFPAIDVLKSVSRLMKDIITEDHMTAANHLKSLLATYQEVEDLINIGAYKKGSNRDIDLAIKYRDAIRSFCQQDIHENCYWEETVKRLIDQFKELNR